MASKETMSSIERDKEEKTYKDMLGRKDQNKTADKSDNKTWKNK